MTFCGKYALVKSSKSIICCWLIANHNPWGDDKDAKELAADVTPTNIITLCKAIFASSSTSWLVVFVFAINSLDTQALEESV